MARGRYRRWEQFLDGPDAIGYQDALEAISEHLKVLLGEQADMTVTKDHISSLPSVNNVAKPKGYRGKEADAYRDGFRKGCYDAKHWLIRKLAQNFLLSEAEITNLNLALSQQKGQPQ
jgi:hypothetical protein